MLPLVSPSLASPVITVTFATALFSLYNRGAPPTDNEDQFTMRPPKRKEIALSLGITLLAGGIGASISSILFGSILGWLSQELVISMCISAAFFVSSTFFKVQD